MLVDCFVFPLGGVDVILGVTWLEKLGDVKANWAIMIMDFKVANQCVHLVGNSLSLTRLQISFSSLEKLDKKDLSCLLREFTTSPSTNNLALDLTVSQHSQLRWFLDHHYQIFDEPQGLPPLRPNDHKIILTTGYSPLCKTNKAIDALSRKGEDMDLSAITLPFYMDWAQLDTTVSRDISLHAICELLLKDLASCPAYQLVNGPSVYWKGMLKDVQQFVFECLIYQKNKYDTLAPIGLLRPLAVLEVVWEDITMDFITMTSSFKRI
nr:peroxidase 64 [Ipomoea batatas]